MSGRPLLDLARAGVVDLQVAVILRAKSGMERLRLAHEAWDLMHARLGAYLAAAHPEWSPDQVQAAVAKRLLRESG